MYREDGNPGGSEQFDTIVDPTGEIKNVGLSAEDIEQRQQIQANFESTLANMPDLLTENYQAQEPFDPQRDGHRRRELFASLHDLALGADYADPEDAPRIAALAHSVKDRIINKPATFGGVASESDLIAQIDGMTPAAVADFNQVKTSLYGSAQVQPHIQSGRLGNLVGPTDPKAEVNIGKGIMMLQLGDTEYATRIPVLADQSGDYVVGQPDGQVELAPNETVTLGRGKNGLTSQAVSAQHLMLTRLDNNDIRVEDTSRNGTSYKIIEYPDVHEYKQMAIDAHRDDRAAQARHKLDRLT